MERMLDSRPLCPVAEWTIENISCWNREVHGSVIRSPDFIPEVGFVKLHPRGYTGSGKISVTIISKNFSCLSGDLCFIGPDGSAFCTREINAHDYDVYDDDDEDEVEEDVKEEVEDCIRDEMEEEYVKEEDFKREVDSEISSGLDIEEILARIGRAENFQYKDQLTLRFRLKGFYGYKLCMRTEICVRDISVKFSRSVFPGIFSYDSNEILISDILHPFYEDKIPHLFLRANVFCLTVYPYIDFYLESTGDEKVLIRTCMSVLNEDDTVRSQRKEHVFKDGEYLMLSDKFVLKEEVFQEGVSLLVSLKIIPSRMQNFKYNYSTPTMNPGSVQVTSTNTLTPSSFSTVVRKTPQNLLESPRNLPENTSNAPPKCFSFDQPRIDVLTKDLMCLYQDKDFSDITLKCDNVSFPVHKNILSARSPVFKTMLSIDMAESSSGEVDIGDLDPSTLSRFLTHLYTGTAEEELLDDSALKLYYAADKYQVPSLKRDCSDFLCANVSVSNVCDILSLADRHQDVELTAASHNFILNNFNSVLKSNEWEGFMCREPLLAVKTVTHFAAKDRVRMHDSK